jgi:hypothetical protein
MKLSKLRRRRFPNGETRHQSNVRDYFFVSAN